VLESLSPRECAELEAAAARGERWPRVITRLFVDGTRLVLGIDSAVSEARIAAAAGIERSAVAGEVGRAARWAVAHGLHLLGFPGADPDVGLLHFMAVG
jgi:hypothetical protein